MIYITFPTCIIVTQKIFVATFMSVYVQGLSSKWKQLQVPYNENKRINDTFENTFSIHQILLVFCKVVSWIAIQGVLLSSYSK